MIEITGPIAWIIAIIIMIIMSLFIWASLWISSCADEWEESPEVEDMDVYEALQLVIKTLENNTSCGRLEEKVRIAKITLINYVNKKLAEENEKEDIK